MQTSIQASTLTTGQFERFMASPTGQRLTVEYDAEQLALRKQLVAERMALQAQLGDVGTQLAERVAKARKDAEQAEAKAQAARQQLVQAEATQTSTTHALEQRATKLERQLRESASSSITDFLGWVEDILQSADLTRPVVEFGLVTFGDRPVGSTWRSVAAARARVSAARAAAVALTLEALNYQALTDKLSALRREVEAALESVTLEWQVVPKGSPASASAAARG